MFIKYISVNKSVNVVHESYSKNQCVNVNVNANVYVNVNVNICNALEFPKEQKYGYLLWSIEAKMVQLCFKLRSK